jgi:diketogulonate reductase-like aldo/keto reductase
MRITRRRLLQGLAAVGAVPIVGARAQMAPILTRPIPASSEALPLMGLGSWITFNVGEDVKLLDECAAVIAAFFEAGGRLIDSSPMYSSSQPAIGYGLKKLGYPQALFAATKVWTSDARSGPEQMEESRALWGVKRFDLMQIHNLLAWEQHLPTLLKMKADGKLRYVGITTSHGRRHDDLEAIMKSKPIDFIQVTYNMHDREVEKRLLPLARDKGIAIIINRPFRGGPLVREMERHDLPPWAAETGATNWAQFLLKFIISHPAVSCAIPATTSVDHLRQNIAAATGILPDDKLRRRMADYVGQL